MLSLELLFLCPTPDESHLRMSFTETTLTPSPLSISRFLLRFVSLFNIEPNRPKPWFLFWVLDFEADDDDDDDDDDECF